MSRVTFQKQKTAIKGGKKNAVISYNLHNLSTNCSAVSKYLAETKQIPSHPSHCITNVPSTFGCRAWELKESVLSAELPRL